MGEKKLDLKTETSIEDLFHTYWNFFSKSSKPITREGENFSTDQFIKVVSMKSHRSRGVDVEKRIALKNNWTKGKKSDESGDLIDNGGNCVEVKSSLVTPVKPTVTLRGFRPWEKAVAYYIIVILDIRKFQTEVAFDIFNLPASYVTSANGFSPFGQSEKARAGAKNVPLGINMDTDGSIFADWTREFKVSNISF